MAKKKVIEDIVQDNPVSTENNSNPIPEEVKPITNKEDIPKNVLSILTNYKKYESLYIDSYGGCYTASTPANIRGNAILYKNPFFES